MKFTKMCAAACGVLLLGISPAAAQGDRTRLAVDYAAPPGCPDIARLSDEVSARLGYAAIDAGASTSRGTAYGVGFSFEPICIAPCERELAPGTERYAVSENGGSPVIVEGPIPLEADSALSLSYDSRALERSLGWVTFGLGVAAGGGMVIGGLLMMTSGSSLDPAPMANSDADVGTALLIAGGAVTLASVVAGLILTWLDDVASIDVQSLRF